MRLPIRLRLTAWYVGLLALVIAGLGAFVVLRLRADRIADVDRSLRSSAAQIAHDYRLEGRPEFFDVSATILRAVPEGKSGAQLIAPGGRVSARYGTDTPTTPLLSRRDVRSALAGHEVVRTVRTPLKHEPFRIVARSARDRRRRQALVVASSIDGINAAIHRLVVLLLLAGPAALALTAAGGWWLSRKALRPVAEMTTQADRIEMDRLDERVEVPRASDEISRLGQTLNRMLDRLSRGVEEKRQLVADASHELRTPLATMQSELDVALGYDELQPEAAAVLQSAREEVQRMTRIVENLLTLARADEGRLDLLSRPVELRPAAEEAVAGLSEIASTREVRLELEGDGEVVQGDRDRLRQVLSNLVENAIKYSPAGTEVRVAIWHDGAEAGVTVTDQGMGIPAADLSHVFERFYRVDSSRRRGDGGSGLGLAICRTIVDAHGGRIWAASQEGRGSEFSFALPAS
ncbi:MAG: sensor histidine kinase [Thermoleophilaceae bacterium]